jgi:sugar phosphate isomerase/epimerase
MKNEIGVMASLREDGSSLKPVADFGLLVCQLVSWAQEQWTDEKAKGIKAEIEETGVRITSFWAGWPQPAVWDFIDGPETLGLVPEAYRAERVPVLKKAADFAAKIGLPAIITHLGFIPENAKDPQLEPLVEVVREIAQHCKDLGIEFWFETGQETPVAMLRLIELVGTGNLGINLDPANLILYGKANPIDALDVFGTHVKNIHAKDGLYPTDPMKLGHEVKVGTGKVRFPEFVKALNDVGFTGEFIIEREISGEQQQKDIRETITYLANLLEQEQ